MPSPVVTPRIDSKAKFEGMLGKPVEGSEYLWLGQGSLQQWPDPSLENSYKTWMGGKTCLKTLETNQYSKDLRV